jgi:hypothetical protein
VKIKIIDFKKIIIVLLIGLALFNISIGNRSNKRSDVDLNDFALIAVASDETEEEEKDPLISTMSIIDWLGEFIGF